MKYYTGKPCKNGHVSERYTKPASCCACVAAGNGRILATVSSNFDAKMEALTELRVFWVLIDHADLARYYEMLQLEFVMSYPHLQASDLPRPSARKPGEPFYRVLAPHASVYDLRQYADCLWSETRKAQRQASLAETAKRLAAQIAAANEGDDDSGPSDNWAK